MTVKTFSFVKAINVVGKKWPEILLKNPTLSFVLFVSKQSLIRLCNWATLIAFSRFKFDKPEDAGITVKSNRYTILL